MNYDQLQLHAKENKIQRDQSDKVKKNFDHVVDFQYILLEVMIHHMDEHHLLSLDLSKEKKVP
jgi:hypothetical protein